MAYLGLSSIRTFAPKDLPDVIHHEKAQQQSLLRLYPEMFMGWTQWKDVENT